MKTISLELSKRLAPHLEEMDVEYSIEIETGRLWKTKDLPSSDIYKDKFIKTLTLEEAIEKMLIYLLDNDLLGKKK